MQAHALVIRMTDLSLNFPYMSFLVSGGHCLLTIVKSADEFEILGDCVDIAPGNVIDKVFLNKK